ncbi:hypothetical protein E2C01_053481 [Portunus trituberculatus]|uniref:Uncharacterized protein n=1 Tax=Portunus trituberculatus TaxID=210409 RepID=A0A5B7GH81_PORTR|nr:hypothetical protein [Portunus trituberculatus]
MSRRRSSRTTTTTTTTVFVEPRGAVCGAVPGRAAVPRQAGRGAAALTGGVQAWQVRWLVLCCGSGSGDTVLVAAGCDLPGHLPCTAAATATAALSLMLVSVGVY